MRQGQLVEVAAWNLEEGAELEDGTRVLVVHRDAVARTVRYVTAAGSRPARADAPVRVVRR